MRAEYIFAAVVGVVGVGCDLLNANGTPAPTAWPDAAPASGTAWDGGILIANPPMSWDASNCSGVGNLCSAGCGSAGQCQVGLNVCVPMSGKNGFPPPSQETPYCLAATCMTYEQASCFCSGAAGQQFSLCPLGPPGVLGVCGSEGKTCGTCCKGLQCVKDSPTSGTCYTACDAGTQCDSGCCTDLKSTGDLECAPATACQTPCTQQGQACSDATRCCNGTCVSSTPNPEFLGCRPSCTSNADCLTGCCQPFSNASGGFCVDAHYCMCTPVGGDCTFTQNCCAGSSCGASGDAGQYVCYKNCMGANDCDGGCCTTYLPGKHYGTCAPNCL
jgi:hypothetical protein